jgi:flagellar hook-length control protein FliK
MIRFQSRSIPPFPFLPTEKVGEQGGSSLFAGLLHLLNGQSNGQVTGLGTEAGADSTAGQEMPLLEALLNRSSAEGAEGGEEVSDAISEILDPLEDRIDGEIDPTETPDGTLAMFTPQQSEVVAEHLTAAAQQAGIAADPKSSRISGISPDKASPVQTPFGADGQALAEEPVQARSITEAGPNALLTIEQLVEQQNVKAAESRIADLKALSSVSGGARRAGGAPKFQAGPTALGDQMNSPLMEPFPQTPESRPLHLEFTRAPIAGTSSTQSHSSATDASEARATPEGGDRATSNPISALGGQWGTSARHGIGSQDMATRDQTAVTRVIRQVTGPVHIAMASQGDTKTVTVHLTPPDLGRIEISVEGPEEHTGRVEVMIRGDRPDTERLLSQHLPTLREALESQGINLGDLTLNFAGHGQQAEGQGDSSESRDFASGQVAPEEEVITESVPLPVQRIAAGHRISVVA